MRIPQAAMLQGICRRVYSVRPKSMSSKMTKPWRDAASLIVATPADKSTGKYATDYQILFLKRTAKASFYANAYVYPGGAVDEADKHPKWIEIFTKIDPSFCDNVPREFFAENTDKKTRSLFPGDVNALKNGVLPNEIAFRICAIRESFEESGILLLTSDVESRRSTPGEIHAESVTSLLSDIDLDQWRKRVHNNAMEFMDLCQELHKVPDIWSLKEWFQWLTPAIKRLPRRYDTVFYSCCLKEAPTYYHHDKEEMTESLWTTPANMMQLFVQNKVILGPPQILETLKLLNFNDIKSLAAYMNERALKGMVQWMPYFKRTTDGKVLELLPGDDLYPKDIDAYNEKLRSIPTEIEVVDKTHSEIISSPGNHFKFFASGEPAYKLATMMCNVTLDYGHIRPVVLKNPGVLAEAKM